MCDTGVPVGKGLPCGNYVASLHWHFCFRFHSCTLSTQTSFGVNYVNGVINVSTELPFCKGVLLIVIRCNKVTNFLIPSAGN